MNPSGGETFKIHFQLLLGNFQSWGLQFLAPFELYFVFVYISYVIDGVIIKGTFHVPITPLNYFHFFLP